MPRDVRIMVDTMRTDGKQARSIQYVHATLRVALEHAFREELVTRNVARLVRIEQPRKIHVTDPMTAAEARKFLDAVRDHPMSALWWEHVDFAAGTLRIMQTVQRVDGQLRELPTKTRRSNRTVPLPGALPLRPRRPSQPATAAARRRRSALATRRIRVRHPLGHADGAA